MRSRATALIAGLLFFTTIGAAPLGDPQMISAQADLSFVIKHVQSLYYGHVTYQSLLEGERRGLERYLRTHALAANIPAVNTPENAGDAVAAAQAELRDVLQQYGARLNAHDAAVAAIKGVADAPQDRYTTYLTAEEFRDFNNVLEPQTFTGIGVIVESDPASKYISVYDVSEGGPSARAGIKQDDLIVSIDGHDTHGMTVAGSSKLLRGKERTPVNLRVRRGNQTLSLTLTRDIVRPATVVKHMLANGVAYISISVFGDNTAQEFEHALTDLQSRGARGLVIDLRDNGGGYVDAALSIASKFINTTPIVSTETRGGKFMTYYGDNEALTPVPPVVVLANNYSASASELTIGALQDSGVATVVGTKTFGKGVMQELYPLADGSALKVTIARYFTPKNRDINHVGIAPDVAVTENANAVYGLPDKDAQLAAALRIMDARLAKN